MQRPGVQPLARVDCRNFCQVLVGYSGLAGRCCCLVYAGRFCGPLLHVRKPYVANSVTSTCVVKCCELPNPGQEEQVVPTAEVPYNAKPSAEAFGAGT